MYSYESDLMMPSSWTVNPRERRSWRRRRFYHQPHLNSSFFDFSLHQSPRCHPVIHTELAEELSRFSRVLSHWKVHRAYYDLIRAMPTLYDLPSLLNQNTEDINFSAHLRFMAMAFHVAVHTFVVRSRLREVRTMPFVECELFAVAISHNPIVLRRSAAVRFDASRVNPSIL